MNSIRYFVNFLFLVVVLHLSVASLKNAKKVQANPAPVESGINDSKFWLAQMNKMIRPVIFNMANNSLKANMPQVVSIHSDNPESRKKVAYLEIFSRTLCGIAPWLQLEGGSSEE